MKFSIFTGEKNFCILHGQVFIMQPVPEKKIFEGFLPYMGMKSSHQALQSRV